MATAQKKAILRNLNGELLWGYLPASGFAEAGGIKFLDVTGKVISLDMCDVKWIAYVKDFNLDEQREPEQMGRREFSGRPRGEGLWVRLEFVDGDSMEGLAHVDSGFLDSLVEDGGFVMSVPDARANTQRLFVPRRAVAGLQVMGYIGAPAKRKVKVGVGAQRDLFGE